MAEETVVDLESMTTRTKRKHFYRIRLLEYLNLYKSILVIGVDFVGSNQLQKSRIQLRGKAVMLMGKNTVIRSLFKEQMEKFPHLVDLLPSIRGNVGFIFTNSDLVGIRDVVVANKVPAAAKAGINAPADVFIPAGPTTMDPGQTAFFQALNIPTKITKGAIEIINQVHLCKLGDPVTPSAVALLSKLNVKPFFYGIQVSTVCDNGSVFDVSVLDMGENEVINMFLNAANKLAAISLETGIPNLASIPHSIKYTFKKLVAIALETKVFFAEAAKIKEMLDNPGAFAAAAPAAGGAPAAAAAVVEEEEEEEEAAPVADMFGGGSAAAKDY